MPGPRSHETGFDVALAVGYPSGIRTWTTASPRIGGAPEGSQAGPGVRNIAYAADRPLSTQVAGKAAVHILRDRSHTGAAPLKYNFLFSSDLA